LVLFAESELSPEESGEIEAHLESCAVCRGELKKFEAVRLALNDPGLFSSGSEPWDLLPERIAARAVESRGPGRWIPSNFGTWAWAGTLAATLLLVLGVVGRLHQMAPLPGASRAGAGNREFVRQLASVYAKEATSRYLADCQDLLLNVMRAEQSCNGEKYDVSMEIERARELLKRKRLLEAELRDPGVARAKELCDELENLLVNMSTAQTCESGDTLRSLERFIQREQLMLRINLVRSELS